MSWSVGQELKTTLRNAHTFVKWVLLSLVVLLLVAYLRSGFYTIDPKQIGVLEILGKVVDKRVPPGAHYTFPWPFSKVYKVPVKEVQRLVIDDFFQDSQADSRSAVFYQLTGLESYCLSGDNNAVQVQIVVQYTISDPYNYLFGASGKDVLLRDIICREIIHSLAVRPVDDILTIGKREIKDLLQFRAQEKLAANNSGLLISSVEIKEVRPPSSVQSYFDDVINAQVDKKKMISGAESYYNEEIPAARAEKERMLKEAESHRDKVIKAAQGEGERFLQKLVEYQKEPEITRKRLYLEFARETLGQLKNIYLLEKKAGETPVRLRILSLE